MNRSAFKCMSSCIIVAVSGWSGYASSEPLEKISLPDGFSITRYVDNVENPRQMALGDNGTVFVGSRLGSKVHAVVDTNGDGKADKTYVVFDTASMPKESRVRMPSGVAFKDGSLYIAAINFIFRLDDIENNLANPPEPVIVVDDLPNAGHHGWKYIAFGPDGKLYVPVGAPCNICERDDERYSSITRMNADGSGREIVAKGVRNTVGFDWHPETGELWFTDNGADGMGDDMPADELNRISEDGQHFGFPYVHQGDTLDRRFGQGKKVGDYVAPMQKLAPHAAALGMLFYTGDMFPPEYKNQIFIAEHGSWNRSKKVSYNVTTVFLDKGKPVMYEPFAEGWLEGEEEWGRPTDLLQLPDGSLLLTDSDTKAIYRITYSK